MILIADSGSTKTSWCLVDDNNSCTFFESEGYNPFHVETAYIIKSLGACLPADLTPGSVREVHFYGSGCVAEKVSVVSDAMRELFAAAEIKVDSDLLASARALLGNTPGFAAILGTGTNSCLYDGTRITHNVSSLGYILGDEGSGSNLGKRLLIDYLRGKMPKELESKFSSQHQLTAAEILDRIYRKPLANRFCAGFSRFLYENISHSYSVQVVRNSFRDFFENLVSAYPDYKRYTFNSVGSIAFYFQDVLKDVAAEYGMETGKIVRSPMEGLIVYHREHVQRSI